MARRKFVTEKFGWAPETVRRYGIGWWAYGKRGRYSIPILDEEGLIRNIRLYDPLADGMNKTISWKSGYGRARLFPIDSLQAQTIFIAEGEKDCILLNQQIQSFAADANWAAITTTSGAATWNDEWSSLFSDKDVVVVYDVDAAGKANAPRVATSVVPFARSVKVVALDLDDVPRGDVTDYFITAGKGWDDFAQLLDTTDAFDPADHYPDLDFGFWASVEEAIAGDDGNPTPTDTTSPEEQDPRVGDRIHAGEDGNDSSSAPAHLLGGWEPPLLLGVSSRLPSFPTDAFPSWLRDYIEGVAVETQTPPDLAGMLALATLSTLLAKKVVVHVR